MTDPIDTLVVSGAPVSDPEAYREIVASVRTVVAVDSGARLCMLLDRAPDMLVGDLDSVGPDTLLWVRESVPRIVELDPVKDMSDLDAAFSLIAAEDLGAPVLTAAFGGRLDHALAAAGTLAHHAPLSPRVREPDTQGWVLAPSGTPALTLTRTGATVSVVPLLGPASVSITGVRYPLDRHRMPALGSLGISNVVEGPEARIEVHEGVVLVLAPTGGGSGA